MDKDSMLNLGGEAKVNPRQMLNDYRRRIAMGEAVTDEEIKEALKNLRALCSKEALDTPKPKSAKSKKAAKPDANDLLAGLLNDL